MKIFKDKYILNANKYQELHNVKKYYQLYWIYTCYVVKLKFRGRVCYIYVWYAVTDKRLFKLQNECVWIQCL